MQIIELHNNKGQVKVDDDIYDDLLRFRWWLHATKTKNYAYTAMTLEGKRKNVLMHRYIMKAPSGTIVDHKDRDGLNNVRSNLRFATHSQNIANTEPKSGKYKGVSWDGKRKQWVAGIEHMNRGYNLGRFESPEEAAKAYDRKALEFFGEFAWLNFPSDFKGGK